MYRFFILSLFCIIWVSPILSGCTSLNSSSQIKDSTTFISPDPTLEEMVGISPVIFYGVVVSLRYGKHKGANLPYTFVRFKGTQFIRNDADITLKKSGEIEISYIGGIQDNLNMLWVSHQPSLDLGKRYLVFLRGGKWQFNPIAGNEKGVFLLRGSLSNPKVYSMSGIPIKSFNGGHPIFGKIKPENNSNYSRTIVSNIPLKRAKELGLVQGEKLSPEEIEKREQSLNKLATSLDRKVKEENIDSKNTKKYESNAMTLSELSKQIKSLIKHTKGKYRGFEYIELTPTIKAIQFKSAEESKQNK